MNTALAPTPPHQPRCMCLTCRIFRAMSHYDPALLLFHEKKMGITPPSDDRPGNTRYRPEKPFLLLQTVHIGPTPEQSSTLYSWSVPGERSPRTIELPGEMNVDDM